MVKTLVTIVGALLVTGVGLIFLRRDLTTQDGAPPFSIFPISSSVSSKTVVIGSKEYQVVVADTPEKREKGLSGTDQIPDKGMLFHFEEAGIYPFWMKDMKYDLDFIWIADDKVVEITPNVPHPNADSEPSALPVYASTKPVTMMLEVAAGFAEQEGIMVGDAVSLKK